MMQLGTNTHQQVDFFAKGEGVDDLFFYFFPGDLFEGFGVKAELFLVAVF